MEILTSVKRLYISFKSLVNDFVYSFDRAALLLLVEVQNHTVPVRERGRIRVNIFLDMMLRRPQRCVCLHYWPRIFKKYATAFCVTKTAIFVDGGEVYIVMLFHNLIHLEVPPWRSVVPYMCIVPVVFSFLPAFDV